jgi:hypothetical protein
VLVAYRDADQLVRRKPAMSIARPPETPTPFVPQVGDAELARRNRAARDRIASWMNDGDEEEQRATMGILRDALGARRTLSARPLFP